jgi:hypothetical protein
VRCPFCFANYQRGRKRGQCRYLGCSCRAYAPLIDKATPAKAYAERVLRRGGRLARQNLPGNRANRALIAAPTSAILMQAIDIPYLVRLARGLLIQLFGTIGSDVSSTPTGEGS